MTECLFYDVIFIFRLSLLSEAWPACVWKTIVHKLATSWSSYRCIISAHHRASVTPVFEPAIDNHNHFTQSHYFKYRHRVSFGFSNMNAIVLKQLRSRVGKNSLRRASRSWSVHSRTSLAFFQTAQPIRSFTATTQRSDFIDYAGVSSSVGKVINTHAHQPQTSVSLQALMRTGRGEFLHKSFDEEKLDNDQHTATELVLIQVGSVQSCCHRVTLALLAKNSFPSCRLQVFCDESCLFD
jgi:hypothetical protein